MHSLTESGCKRECIPATARRAVRKKGQEREGERARGEGRESIPATARRVPARHRPPLPKRLPAGACMRRAGPRGTKRWQAQLLVSVNAGLAPRVRICKLSSSCPYTQAQLLVSVYASSAPRVRILVSGPCMRPAGLRGVRGWGQGSESAAPLRLRLQSRRRLTACAGPGRARFSFVRQGFSDLG